jgi:hypothetical protein
MNSVRGRAGHVTRETTEGWMDCGEVTWLITSQRIVGRLPASSEMISVWWSGLAGVKLDLDQDRIILNGVNGWTGMLVGPAIAPIGVAAVAMCHGCEAVFTHPSLVAVRASAVWDLTPAQGRKANPHEATIYVLPTRARVP